MGCPPAHAHLRLVIVVEKPCCHPCTDIKLHQNPIVYHTIAPSSSFEYRFSTRRIGHIYRNACTDNTSIGIKNLRACKPRHREFDGWIYEIQLREAGFISCIPEYEAIYLPYFYRLTSAAYVAIHYHNVL